MRIIAIAFVFFYLSLNKLDFKGYASTSPEK